MYDVASGAGVGNAPHGFDADEGCGMPTDAPGVGVVDPVNIEPRVGDPKPIPYVGGCACGGLHGDELSPGNPGGLNCS